MNKSKASTWPLSLVLAGISLTAAAETFVIPFSEIRQAVSDSGQAADAAIEDFLVDRIRAELDALGLNVDGGLIFGEVPIEEMTRIIRTDCSFVRPYEIHTDTTTATIALDDSSSSTVALDSIHSIGVGANLTGTISTETRAWVRWGQDILFVGDCVRINTDHGWLGLTQPFELDIDLALDLNPSFDADLIAIVVDKHATLSGQVRFEGGDLQHDFGSLSPTDLVISVFEEELLEALTSEGEAAVAEAISALNFRLDGLDENGVPDATIVAFNGPTTFVLDANEEDQAFIRELLLELGIPELVLAMIEDRGIEVLLQLVLLEGTDREAYLASLGAEISCEALLGNFRIPLPAVPLFVNENGSCAPADQSGLYTGSYFTDSACSQEIAFEPTDDLEFCVSQIGDQAKTLVGNAAAWTAHTGQPNDPLPGTPSRAWTSLPSTQLDIGVVSLQGNHQPYLKQLRYKTVAVEGRGNGSCELEMRVYKRDIAAQDLKPLIALHGGTWQHRGASFWGLEAGISHWTDRGFAVFAPFYRLVGESDGNAECNAATWREVTADVESALDWVIANAPSLGAREDTRVSVFGQSAGAHLAAWLAAHRSGDVQKALLYYAPVDVLDFLAGATIPGGPYAAYRYFGLNALARYFGARNGTAELRLGDMSFAGLTPALLATEWASLIPASVFDLTTIEPLRPPLYVARCAALSQIDLGAINLSMPPDALVDCLKQDLSSFLVDNSFNHLLSAEPVPVFAVHGSADTIVPYQQAQGLCGSIDGSMLADDVVDPWTVYSCGSASELHIVRDAGHSLDLGVCLAPFCPAGEIGSSTRDAVVAAVSAAHAWAASESKGGSTIDIERAWWFVDDDKLAVQATSDLGADADLRMHVLFEGGGTVTRQLRWHAEKNRWWTIIYDVSEKFGLPGTITVTGAGSSASAEVVYK